jgi:serine/threonine-protein kinase
LLEGRYRLHDVCGRGGFATVYAAEDTRLRTPVAVKLLDVIPDPATLRRLETEVEIGARMAHPRLIRVIDMGVHAGRPFVVMPLLHGRPLTSRCGSDWRSVCALMAQFLDGMRALHEARAFARADQRTRLLHRDIKPANCFVSDDGDLVILDFGLVKPLDRPADETASGQILGTPAYMAPECLFGERATERSDVYSLGVTFFELLTGERPYAADVPGLRGIHAAMRPPPRVRDRRPEVPAPLCALVAAMMAPLPADRPVGVAVVLRDLEKFMRRRGAAHTRLLALSSAEHLPAASPANDPSPPPCPADPRPGPAPTRRWPTVVLAVVLVSLWALALRPATSPTPVDLRPVLRDIFIRARRAAASAADRSPISPTPSTRDGAPPSTAASPAAPPGSSSSAPPSRRKARRPSSGASTGARWPTPALERRLRACMRAAGVDVLDARVRLDPDRGAVEHVGVVDRAPGDRLVTCVADAVRDAPPPAAPPLRRVQLSARGTP